MKTKTCTKCKITKPVTEFYKDKQKKDGLTSQCKECRIKYTQAHRKQIKEYNKKYKESHKEEANELSREKKLI